MCSICASARSTSSMYAANSLEHHWQSADQQARLWRRMMEQSPHASGLDGGPDSRSRCRSRSQSGHFRRALLVYSCRAPKRLIFHSLKLSSWLHRLDYAIARRPITSPEKTAMSRPSISPDCETDPAGPISF